MTPQNEAQMDEEFEKTDRELADSFTEKIIFSRGFKSAYSLQQEKIDKLEKENKSLRSDLDWATAYCLRRGILYSTRKAAEEIRKRHKLDEIKE